MARATVVAGLSANRHDRPRRSVVITVDVELVAQDPRFTLGLGSTNQGGDRLHEVSGAGGELVLVEVDDLRRRGPLRAVRV